jgi:hypothetical protein
MELNYLDQLVDFGYAEKTTKILNDKVTMKLRSLGAEDQLLLESIMTGVQGSAAYVVHTYTIQLLSYVLKEYSTAKKAEVFKTSEEAKTFMKTQASVIIDAILSEYNKFVNEIKTQVTPENIDANFSTTPPTDSELK